MVLKPLKIRPPHVHFAWLFSNYTEKKKREPKRLSWRVILKIGSLLSGFQTWLLREKTAPPSEVAPFSKTAPAWSRFGSTFFSVMIFMSNFVFILNYSGLQCDIIRGTIWQWAINQGLSSCMSYYNQTSALTPDGGLINGVGAQSQRKHMKK